MDSGRKLECPDKKKQKTLWCRNSISISICSHERFRGNVIKCEVSHCSWTELFSSNSKVVGHILNQFLISLDIFTPAMVYNDHVQYNYNAAQLSDDLRQAWSTWWSATSIMENATHSFAVFLGSYFFFCILWVGNFSCRNPLSPPTIVTDKPCRVTKGMG